MRAEVLLGWSEVFLHVIAIMTFIRKFFIVKKLDLIRF